MCDYARYYKQQLLSDCDLIISWPKSESPRDGEGSMDCAEDVQPDSDEGSSSSVDAEIPRESFSFPAHQLLLFKSSHFEAQGLRWQHPSTSMQEAAGDQHVNSAPVALRLIEKAELVLRIDTKEQLPAAEAVVAALYGVGHCFSSLPHNQLVHALVIADRIDLPGVAEQIVQALKTAAATAAGLSSTALEAMANLSAWPDCMYKILPPLLSHFTQKKLMMMTAVKELEVILAADSNGLICNIMLAAFRDLQAVWQNSALSQLLMKLPLPAIQLLLSSDKLQVPSEDVVLYTAEQYIKNWLHTSNNMQRLAALSSLVRAPFLSDFALQLIALSNSYFGQLLTISSKEQDQLRQLIALRRVTGSQPPVSSLELLSGAPKSWLQGPRSLVTEKPASVIWKLPVEQLAKSCQRAAEQKSTEQISGPDSPSIGALAWQMSVHCKGNQDGAVVGLFVGYCKAVHGHFHKFQSCIIHNNKEHVLESGCVTVGTSWGWHDFFAVGPMVGGWDAAAWSAKGLPTTGDLVLELRMLKVL